MTLKPSITNVYHRGGGVCVWGGGERKSEAFFQNVIFAVEDKSLRFHFAVKGKTFE